MLINTVYHFVDPDLEVLFEREKATWGGIGFGFEIGVGGWRKYNVEPVRFLDPRSFPEGSYELGLSFHLPVLLPVLLSGSFLGIGVLVFTETLYVVSGPYRDVHGRTQFFGKNHIPAKVTKNGQKCPKNGVFGFLGKSVHKYCPEMV